MKKRWMRPVLFSVIGGVAGFAYYHYVGCATGTCPITGNPYIATIYGAFMGTVLGWPKAAGTPADSGRNAGEERGS